MFAHILKITFRNYPKNLLFTMIIVSGLAISMATILVITSYIIREDRTDRFHKESNNIFLVQNVNSKGSEAPAAIYMSDIYLLIHEKANIPSMNCRLR